VPSRHQSKPWYCRDSTAFTGAALPVWTKSVGIISGCSLVFS
jgi:hypothetical protein